MHFGVAIFRCRVRVAARNVEKQPQPLFVAYLPILANDPSPALFPNLIRDSSALALFSNTL